jgi:hypothetical protein
MQTSDKQDDALVDAVTERLTEAGMGERAIKSQERLALSALPRSFESSDSHRRKGFSPQCRTSLSGTARQSELHRGWFSVPGPGAFKASPGPLMSRRRRP